MGRPLNKKFFGDPAGGGYQVACNAYLTQAGASAPCYIVEQRSNTRYRVAEVTPTGGAPFVVGTQYIIATVGSTDFTAIGASANTVGVLFTATGVGAGTGTASETEICKLVDATPGAPVNGVAQMQVVVTPENATTPVKATFTVNRTAGGAIDNTATVITSGGYGYWTDGTFNIGVATDGGYAAGTEAVVTYTVANGSIVTANVTTPGAGFTASADAALVVAAADVAAFAANPLPENARIINEHTVKTFAGNTFAWPIVAPLGGRPGRGSASFTEADIGS